jgi:hypothetical protein
MTDVPTGASRRPSVLSLAFGLWLLLLAALAFIVQGGTVFTSAAAAWPALGTLRDMLMPWFSRPYIF